jgi:hypothetical protein
MRTDRHLRCERCPASMPTRTATLTASSILCPACAARRPPPPSITPTGPLGGDAPAPAGPSPSTLLQKSTAGQ